MKQKIYILASEPLKMKETIDQHAPVDRHFEYEIEGEMRSPSDGYHTFDELYDHRITLYIALCKRSQDFIVNVWRSKLHSDGTSFDGWFILGIHKEQGKQITYHLPNEKWDDTNFAETLEKAPEYDGHSSADVIERLKKL